MIALIVVAGVFGAMIGSFLNVVVWRLPRGESLSHPGSHCPKCNHAIRPWDNVPVISWLILGGRCRDCKAPISWRYPAVELATALLFAGVTWWALAGGVPVHATVAVILAVVAYLYLAAISVALTLIDLDVRRLPNAIVLPAYVVGVVLLVAASIVDGNYGALLVAAIGAVGLGVLYLVLALLSRGGMGFGDVKLAGVLGLFLGWLGWQSLVVGAIAAFLLGGIFGIVLIVSRRATRKTGVPFGPWMLGGAWIGILAGPAITTSYLALFGLGGS